MKNDTCAECGKQLRKVTGNYRFEDAGNPVLLENVQLAECKDCGTRKPIIPKLDRLMHTIAFAVATQPFKLSGRDVWFLRQYSGVNGTEFARLIQVEPETLSRWENEKQEMGKNTERLTRFIAVTKSKDLRDRMLEFLEKYRQLTDAESRPRKKLKIDLATMKPEYV